MTTRLQVTLRDATCEDAAALIALWDECGRDAGDDGLGAVVPQSAWRTPSVAEAAEALALNLASPGKRIVLALADGEVVGATVCDLSTLTPITTTRVLRVTDIQVSPRFRRRSVAATLLAAVAAHGEEHDCQVVVAAIPVHAPSWQLML